MPITTKQISICFNTANQYVDTTNVRDIGSAYIQIPFPVKTIIIKEIASDISSDSEYYSLINNDLLGGDSCLGILYIGQTSLIKDYALVKNNRFVFNESKIINGIYNFFLRNSQLRPFAQVDGAFQGDVPAAGSILTISSGLPPSVFNVPLSTGGSLISPALYITSQLTSTTYQLNRTVAAGYVATVFSYPSLTGCIQCVMEFSSE
jgi:hypothetical protein